MNEGRFFVENLPKKQKSMINKCLPILKNRRDRVDLMAMTITDSITSKWNKAVELGKETGPIGTFKGKAKRELAEKMLGYWENWENQKTS